MRSHLTDRRKLVKVVKVVKVDCNVSLAQRFEATTKNLCMQLDIDNFPSGQLLTDLNSIPAKENL